MLKGKTIFLLVFTSIVLVLVLLLLFTKMFSNNKFFKVSLAITAGGIIGNFIDRIFLGAVREFLLVEPFGFICNIADIAICVGMALLCWYIIFMHKFRDKKDKNNNVNKDKQKGGINQK